ncbi:MAG: MATE family efflux transporter [Oscillospiraceae bacterium]|jgi:Na+-driven multidrug efflux pump|nr:MATE family efflux transporter [Oscillospiraceae bacterium]
MTKANLRGQFIHYLIPSVASLVSLSFYILADTFFIANGVGSVGLAALNIALPAYAVVNATAMMLGIGAGVLIAVNRGMGERERMQAAFRTAIVLAAGVGAVYTAIGVLCADKLALLLGASDLSHAYATTYIRVILAYSVFFLLNTTLQCIVRNDENPRLAMASMITNSLANVILDYIFVIVLGWGMWGAAFATGLAAVMGIVILSFHWIRRKSSLTLFDKSVKKQTRRHHDAARLEHDSNNDVTDGFILMAGKIIKGGFSNFITELGNGLVILLFNVTLMRLSGDLAVAAYGIVANIALVISYVFLGVGQGLQPVVSFQFGKGNEANCRKVLFMALRLSVLLGITFFVLGTLFPAQLTALFNGDNNAVLAEITVNAMKTYFFAFLSMGVSIAAASYFQSVMMPGRAMFISVMRSCILVIAGVVILPRLWGLGGVWLVAPAAEGIAMLISIFLIKRTAKDRKSCRAANGYPITKEGIR